MHNEAAMGKMFGNLRTAIVNKPMRLQVITCLQKRAPFFLHFLL